MIAQIQSSNSKRRSWAVVGGGMLGIRLALSLVKKGQAVTLIESAPELGGLASAWDFNGVQWDRHYHVISMTDTRLRALLSELDLEQEIDWVETKTGFFTGGKLYSMSNSMEFLNFPPLNLIEKFRLGATIFCASKIKNWRKLEQIPVEKWLRRWSGNGTFEKIWLPLLRAKLGDNYNKVSAAFIWATIQRMYKARRSGIKKEMFGYVPGGYQTILERAKTVLTRLGVDIQLGRPVQQIVGHNGKVIIQTRDSDQVFDHVIATTPTNVFARFCPQLNSEERQRFEAIEYQGIVCASLLLRKSLSPYYVTNVTDSWVPLTGVIEMTRIVNRKMFDGHHLIYLPKYIPANDAWLDKSDQEIEQIFRKTLFKMYPELDESDVLAFKTSRVRNVMALPVVGYSQNLPPMKTSIPNLYAVNSAHIVKGNLNVNETIEIAEDALDRYFYPLIHQPNASNEQPIGNTKTYVEMATS